MSWGFLCEETDEHCRLRLDENLCTWRDEDGEDWCVVIDSKGVAWTMTYPALAEVWLEPE